MLALALLCSAVCLLLNVSDAWKPLPSFLATTSTAIHHAKSFLFMHTPRQGLPPLVNDQLLRAAQGLSTHYTPVWVFRQAGRHLPEYNEYKTTQNKNFLELLQDPIAVTEVTLQPIRRYELDAAILFSDILVVLQALDVEVTMPGGVGITVPHPITSVEDFRHRLANQQIDVKQKLKHVMEAVKLIQIELAGKVPLIGFSGAPWTLMFYILGGSSKRNQQVATSWLHNHPIESKQLLDMLTDVVIEYLSAQVEAGVDLLQVFEAMGEYISEEDFYTWALPSLAKIAKTLKQRYPHVPLLVFPRGACYSIAALQEVGYDVVTIDTHTNRVQARQTLQEGVNPPNASIKHPACIQGNFDVALLEKDNVHCTKERIEQAVAVMLDEFGVHNLIANLGEGLTGKEDPALVDFFIGSVHEQSRKIMAK